MERLLKATLINDVQIQPQLHAGAGVYFEGVAQLEGMGAALQIRLAGGGKAMQP